MGKRKSAKVDQKSESSVSKYAALLVAGTAAVAALLFSLTSAAGDDSATSATAPPAPPAPPGWGPCGLEDRIKLHVNGGVNNGSSNASVDVVLSSVSSFEQVLAEARKLRQPPRAGVKSYELPAERSVRLHARDGRHIASLDALRALVRDAFDVPAGCATAAHVSVVPSGDCWFMPVFGRGVKYAVHLGAQTPSERYVTVQALLTHPRVFQVDNFLSDHEADMLKAAAAEKLNVSRVTTSGDGLIPQRAKKSVRDSENAWVGRSKGWNVLDTDLGVPRVTEITDRLQKRAATLVGIDPAIYAPEPGADWRRERKSDIDFAVQNNFIGSIAGIDDDAHIKSWGVHQEQIQVVRYEAGTGFYQAHIDTRTVPPNEAPPPKGSGRVLTLLVYLTEPSPSDPKSDGTYFPFAYDNEEERAAIDAEMMKHASPETFGLAADMDCARILAGGKTTTSQNRNSIFRPRKGSAVLFYSLDVEYQTHGVVDWRSLHGGCRLPASANNKWVANFWFHNKMLLHAAQRDVAQKLMNEADKERAAGDLQGPVKKIVRALELVPHHTKLHVKAGFWLQAMGRFKEAAHHLRSAVQHHPDLRDAHYGLGVTLAQLDQPVEGMQSLAHALKLLGRAEDPFGARVLQAAMQIAPQAGDARAKEKYDLLFPHVVQATNKWVQEQKILTSKGRTLKPMLGARANLLAKMLPVDVTPELYQVAKEIFGEANNTPE